jgi:hypothetical protein
MPDNSSQYFKCSCRGIKHIKIFSQWIGRKGWRGQGFQDSSVCISLLSSVYWIASQTVRLFGGLWPSASRHPRTLMLFIVFIVFIVLIELSSVNGIAFSTRPCFINPTNSTNPMNTIPLGPFYRSISYVFILLSSEGWLISNSFEALVRFPRVSFRARVIIFFSSSFWAYFREYMRSTSSA